MIKAVKMVPTITKAGLKKAEVFSSDHQLNCFYQG
jgi:hypothetical protein